MPGLRVNRLLYLGLILFFAACRGEVESRAGQNLLLITIDTLRADRLGCYGYAKGATPRIDELARQGVLFEQAVAQVPVTLPSHASILTGMQPPVHGVRDNTSFRLDAEAVTLAEVLKSAGYHTAAFVGAYVLDASFGLDQGFDLYDGSFDTKEESSPRSFAERRAEGVVGRFREWLAQPRTKPFFAWVHLYDPHLPYTPPAPFSERFAASPYDGEIAYVDQQLGILLEELDDSTLVVLTADHGESLGEHGEKTHGFFVYDAALRIPLILANRWMLPSGIRVSSQVQSVDILPSVLELLRIEPPPSAQGESLLPLVRGEPTSERPAYGECFVAQLNFRWAPLRSLRTGGFKYVDAPRPELYDMARDPGESRNLAQDQPGRATEMKKKLEALVSGWPASLSSRQQPDPEALGKLRTLGYAGGGRPTSETGSDLPDPKDRVHLWEKTEQVILNLASGEYAEAGARAQSILEEDPGNLLALEHLAYCRWQQGAPQESIALYRRILALDPARPAIHLYVGNLLWREGRLREAEQAFRAALEVDPKFARAAERLAYLYLSQGQPEPARDLFVRALAFDEKRKEARLGLARSYRAQGRLPEARAEYERLRAAGPGDPEILSEYAQLLFQQGDAAAAEKLLRSSAENPQTGHALAMFLASSGRMPEALAELESILRAHPDFAPAHHDRGVILSRSGSLDEAIRSFERALQLREDPLTRNALGAALCRKERCAEAIPHFEKAVEITPSYRDALENLAAAYEQVGQSREALKVRRKLSVLPRSTGAGR